MLVPFQEPGYIDDDSDNYLGMVTWTSGEVFSEIDCMDRTSQEWSRCMAFSKPRWVSFSSGDQVLNPRELKGNFLNFAALDWSYGTLNSGAIKTLCTLHYWHLPWLGNLDKDERIIYVAFPPLHPHRGLLDLGPKGLKKFITAFLASLPPKKFLWLCLDLAIKFTVQLM